MSVIIKKNPYEWPYLISLVRGKNVLAPQSGIKKMGPTIH
jgi:hypothetical protein